MALKKIFPAFLFGISMTFVVSAEIPAGYYDATDGLMAAALKTSLYNKIKTHTALSYSELWTAFQTTDKRADGKVWDIYSNTTNYTFGIDQDAGSGGSTEGEFYNREHSFPNSWFGGVKDSPMYTDLFHMYPSDKLVNNRRSNYPFGNVVTVSYSSNNGYSLLGTSAEVSGLTVFEPADELKGDLARSYFYMATRYENLVASWTSNANTEMLGGNPYLAFSPWAKQLLLEWSRLDPVSAKEIARNNVIYTNFQHNRNPYIDFPSLAEYVWGDSTTYTFHPSRYTALPVTPVQKEHIVWVKDGLLYVGTEPGNTIEIMDLTGRILSITKAELTETILNTGIKGPLLVRVGGSVKKVVL
jgi:endonuclease I